MKLEDNAAVASEMPATVLGQGVGRHDHTERVDFARLVDAVAFISSGVAVGCKGTVWIITGGRLVPPEQISELFGRVAA